MTTSKIEVDLHESSQQTFKKAQPKLTKRRYQLSKSRAEDPRIPAPTLFDQLKPNNVLGSEADVPLAFPSVSECAVHLELLECFFVLKQRILKANELDPVYAIVPNHQTVSRDGKNVKLKDPMLWERRQVKWPIFVEWAVARFLFWGRAVTEKWSKLPLDWEFTTDDLPPLDVLMVWHSFLLNPKMFKDICINSPFWKIRFPFKVIHAAIDDHTWDYRLSPSATSFFEKKTGLKADPIQDLLQWKPLSGQTLRINTFKFSTNNLHHYASASLNDPVLSSRRTLGAALADAVIRQSAFIEKMNNKLWIRSPALRGTLTRAIARYSQFLTLIKTNPGKMMVPTLDIDLAWHTHQLSPSQYYADTPKLAGRYLNHDDKVVQDKLDTGFTTTRDQYRIRFGKEYRVCGCWDCEALLSAVADVPAGGIPDEGFWGRVYEEVMYFKAVESARRNKQALPIRKGKEKA
jgi:hypothetical protein